MMGLAFVVLEIALVGLVLVLLNARDRRRDRATGLVLDVLDACPQPFRNAIAVNARAPLLSRRVVVVLDMVDCESADVWALLQPLADALPPRVALVVGPRAGRTVSVALSVGARRDERVVFGLP